MSLLDEVRQHLLCCIEIGDDPFPHRSDRANMAWSAAHHRPCLSTYSFHFTGITIDGHHRGFVNDDPTSTGIHKRVCSSQVNGEIGRE